VTEPDPSEPIERQAPDPAEAVQPRAIYRALLVRGLEPSEAANVTAFLAGLPSAGLHWTIPEVEAILRRRAEVQARLTPHADDLPAAPAVTWQTS
jgi:hypothetical protein